MKWQIKVMQLVMSCTLVDQKQAFTLWEQPIYIRGKARKKNIFEDSEVIEERMDDRKVLEELVRGLEFANQLRQVMINGKDNESSATTTTPFVQSLVKNVFRSFTNTLFLLDKYPSYEVSHTTKSEDSQESCKSFNSKNKRGCYKRK